MKRAETLWQAMVLFLVFLMSVGIYTTLGVVWRYQRKAGPAGQAAPASRSGDVVQVLEPLDGAIWQRAMTLVVRAAVMEPGFLQAELHVDGVRVAAQANPAPQTAPWTVELPWSGSSEGRRVLVVQAHGPGGETAASRPVTVTVTPVGQLLFASNRDGAYAIYAMQTDGRGLTRLTAGPGDARQPAPRQEGVWTFVAETETGRSVIRQRRDGEGEGTDLFVGRDPAWSADGARLAYAASLEGASQVFTATVRSGTPAQATPTQVTAEHVYAGQPAWSPDGTRLAYVAERAGNWDIWVTALDGSAPYRLTADPATDWAPAWSPDGSRLAFVSNRGGSHQVYLMRADGSDLRPLTHFPQGAESPAWSPAGFWLAFVAYSGGGSGIHAREIYLMRADGQNLVRLTHNSFDDTEVAWTP